jgi:hypothetical protein
MGASGITVTPPFAPGKAADLDLLLGRPGHAVRPRVFTVADAPARTLPSYDDGGALFSHLTRPGLWSSNNHTLLMCGARDRGTGGLAQPWGDGQSECKPRKAVVRSGLMRARRERGTSFIY